MKELEEINQNIFENIKHIDEEGREYWSARELMLVLEYRKWENFHKVIKDAKSACINSNMLVQEQLPEVRKLSIAGNGKKQYVVDYKLSRYACYLIVQNSDPRKEIVALGQTYFAIQTRKQELSELDYNNMSEDEKRIYQRSLTRIGNYSLNQTAKKAGVKDFAKFHNAGYRGLYNGETADDIAKRKGLRYREEILDNMGLEELAANFFRISLTEQKMKNENIIGEEKSNITHYQVGKNIREFIAKEGGTMPEDLPTPDKSIKELEKNNKLNKIEM